MVESGTEITSTMHYIILNRTALRTKQINYMRSNIHRGQDGATPAIFGFFRGWGESLSPSFRFLDGPAFAFASNSVVRARSPAAIRPTSESAPLNLTAFRTMRSISASNASIESYLSESSFCRIVLRSRASLRGITSKYVGIPSATGSTGSRKIHRLFKGETRSEAGGHVTYTSSLTSVVIMPCRLRFSIHKSFRSVAFTHSFLKRLSTASAQSTGYVPEGLN